MRKETAEFVLDRDHETLPAFSDVSNFCRHYWNERTCAAFPEGIPLPIWLEQNDHQAPYPGDHGIQFALRSEASLLYSYREMAADAESEAEALEWIEAMVGDVSSEL